MKECTRSGNQTYELTNARLEVLPSALIGPAYIIMLECQVTSKYLFFFMEIFQDQLNNRNAYGKFFSGLIKFGDDYPVNILGDQIKKQIRLPLFCAF